MPPAVETDHARLIRRLRKLTSPGPETEEVWADISRAGTPLLTPSPRGGAWRQVTFVWREQSPQAAVYLRLNRVTDKDRVEQGMMARAGESGLWWLTLDLDARMCASYVICPLPPGSEADIASLGGRTPMHPFLPDPANPARIPTGEEQWSSMLVLDLAREQPEWNTVADLPAGSLTAAPSPVPLAGRTRQLWTYVPSGAASTDAVGILVLFDAEVWFGRLGLERALDAAIASGRIAPFAVVAVANADIPDRIDALGVRCRDLVRDLAAEIVPRLRRGHPEISWGGREMTVVAGQSLGGLAALVAALDAPESYGAVIAHSASVWWRPDRTGRPADLTDGGPFWIIDRFAAEAAQDVRLRLDVGTLETATVTHVDELGRILRSRGWNASVGRYVGGHDFAWWRGALLDDLASLFPGS